MKASTREIVSFMIASRIPNLLIICYTQFATAWFLMDGPLSQILSLKFIGLLLSTAAIGAGGYIINDYFDQKIDMINRPDTVVIGTNLSRRNALASHAFLSLSGIIAGFLIDPVIGLAHMLSAILLWAYSGFLKRQLLIGTLVLSLLASISVFSVLLFFKSLNLIAVAYALFGASIIFIRESLKDIISYKGEHVFGIKSVPIVWGIRGAKLFIYAVCLDGVILLVIYLWSIPDWTVRIFFVGLTPFLAWFIMQLREADRKKEFIQLRQYTDLIIVSGLISMSLV